MNDMESAFLPERHWLDVVEVLLEAVLVFAASLHQLLQFCFIDLNALVPQVLELVVAHVQGVLRFFVSGVLDVLEFGLGVQLHQDVFQLIQLVGSCHLVQNMNL